MNAGAFACAFWDWMPITTAFITEEGLFKMTSTGARATCQIHRSDRRSFVLVNGEVRMVMIIAGTVGNCIISELLTESRQSFNSNFASSRRFDAPTLCSLLS